MFTQQTRAIRTEHQVDVAHAVLDDFLKQVRAAGFGVDVDASETDDGQWFLDVSKEGFRTSISWAGRHGFGLYTSESGYGDRATEIFVEPSRTLARLNRLFDQWTSRGFISPPSLAELRQLTNISQEELGRIIQLKQSAISRFEGRDDVKLSPLVSYLGALGGRVEVRVHFDGMDVAIDLPRAKESETCSA
jgi:Helix-turn-helix domain